MRRSLLLVGVCGLMLAVAACSTRSTPTADASSSGDAVDTADTTADVPLANPYGNPDCDPIHPVRCGFPWPSSLYLQPDATRKTGYRLQFGKTTLPVNSGDRPIDPAPYARLDGFSIGTSLLMQWPNLDMANLADEGHIEQSVAKTAAIVWLELDAQGKVVRHVPYFAELDAQEPDPLKKTLYVRPGVILLPATHYVVGVRNLKDKAGQAFVASPAFEALRQGKTAGTILQPRQARFDATFQTLAGEGVAQADLQLAWDFTTKSDESDHAAILKMRDEAMIAVGPQGPEITFTDVQTLTPTEDPDIALYATGTMHVPSYLHQVEVNGTPTLLLNRGADGLPVQNGWEDREFFVRVPRNALGGTAQGLLQYGHGLNGNAKEFESGYLGKIANQHGLILYATHMRGMSQFDTASIVLATTDMDQFSTVTDKLHQGVLEWLLLQRAMKHRLAGQAFIQAAKVTISDQMVYFGNSQGGIFGGTVVALSQDVTRGDLGVPGNNYSLLLQRSTDFESFFDIIRGVFPDTRDQAVLLLTIQLLWDAVDPVTHYRHLNQAPYPNTPSHDVLMDPAKGDYQVAVVTNEIAARSGLGIQLMQGWGKDVALVTPQAFPYKGSGIVLYDFGNAWAPFADLPPVQEDVGVCGQDGACPDHFDCKQVGQDDKAPKHCLRADPHELPRRNPQHIEQMIHFFHTGEIIDVCGGKGCKFP